MKIKIVLHFRFKFQNHFMKYFIYLILTFSLFSEENFLLDRKKDEPIFIKVKKNKSGVRNSLSFIQVDKDQETLSSMGELSTIKLKFNQGSTILKVKEYTIDKKLIFSDKIERIKEGFSFSTFKGKNKKGKAIFQKINFDVHANPLEIQYQDENKKSTIDKNGISKVLFSYNKLGKKISESYFDLLDKPKEDKFGIAKYEFKYDAFGNLLTKKFFDEKNTLTESKNGYAIESNSYDYTSNINGKLVLNEFFDKEKKAKNDKFGIAKYIYNYDKNGNKISEIFKNDKDNYVEDKKGIAKRIWSYDVKGNILLEEEYGKDGKLKNDLTDNVSRTITEYSSSNEVETKQIYFYDENEKPSINEVLGVAYIKITKTPMKNGYEILEEFFDVDKKPCNSLDGYHIVLKNYDNLNNQVYEEYRNVNQELIDSKDGYAKFRASFNGKLLVEESYFSVEDKSVIGDEGYSKQIRKYNNEKKLISIENFGVDNSLTNSELGYAKQINTFNKKGFKTSEEFFDENDKLTTNNEGFAKINFKYNEACLKLKKEADCISLIEYLDKDLKLVDPKKGNAKDEFFYDDKANLILHKEFNKKNELIHQFEFSYINGFKKESAVEHFKNKALRKAVYYLYLVNPFDSSKVLKISLNKLLRPIKFEEEDFKD